MHPPKPVKPDGIETLGLAWRPRKKHWIGLWMPRQDLAARGYPIKSRRLWPPSDRPTAIPTLEDWTALSTACELLQGEMLNWSRPTFATNPLATFDDTLSSLINIYLTHKNSPYQKLRHAVQITYGRRMGYIVRDFGQTRISSLTLDDFTEMYDSWLAPNEHSKGKRRVSHSHEQMVFLRLAFRFGKALKLPGCRDAADVIEEMTFKNVRKRQTVVNAEQVLAIRTEAHRVGKHSIAFAQALQDGLMVRQKDVIGEWIPITNPGLSEVTHGREKWLIGFRWEEIDQSMNLTHRLSKSIRGRDAVADADEGKVKLWSLPLYPPIMEELALIAGVPVSRLTRDKLPATGPMVVAEHNQKPWRQKVFAATWRRIATAVGVPKDVQNRDTRAGATTDAETKGVNIETLRQGLGHSKPETTRIYTRAEEKATADIAMVRFGKPKS